MKDIVEAVALVVVGVCKFATKIVELKFAKSRG